MIDFFEDKKESKYVTFDIIDYNVLNIKKSSNILNYNVGPDLIYDIEDFINKVIKPIYNVEKIESIYTINNLDFHITENTKYIIINSLFYEKRINMIVNKNKSLNFLNLLKEFLGLLKEIQYNNNLEIFKNKIVNHLNIFEIPGKVIKFNHYDYNNNNEDSNDNVFIYLNDFKHCAGFTFLIDLNNHIKFISLIHNEGEIYYYGHEHINLNQLKNKLYYLTDLENKIKDNIDKYNERN